MKRYLAFSGDTYYPGGGWRDFAGSFDTLQEAIDAAATRQFTWGHVVDTDTMEIVWSA